MPKKALEDYTLEELKRREAKLLGKPSTHRRNEKLDLVEAEIEKRKPKSALRGAPKLTTVIDDNAGFVPEQWPKDTVERVIKERRESTNIIKPVVKKKAAKKVVKKVVKKVIKKSVNE